jgi:hypothetical protein
MLPGIIPHPSAVGVGDLSYVASTANATDAASYTFAGHAIGAVAVNRRVIVAVAGRAGASLTFNSLTVGGNAAAKIAERADNTDAANFNCTAIFLVTLDTGTTADIVVTPNTTMLRCVIHVYRGVDINAVAHQTKTAGITDPSTITIDIPSGGNALASICNGDSNSGSYTWTGLTEDYDAVTELRTFSAAHGNFASQQTGRTVTADYSLTTLGQTMVAASFAPG